MVTVKVSSKRCLGLRHFFTMSWDYSDYFPVTSLRCLKSLSEMPFQAGRCLSVVCVHTWDKYLKWVSRQQQHCSQWCFSAWPLCCRTPQRFGSHPRDSGLLLWVRPGCWSFKRSPGDSNVQPSLRTTALEGTKTFKMWSLPLRKSQYTYWAKA